MLLRHVRFGWSRGRTTVLHAVGSDRDGDCHLVKQNPLPGLGSIATLQISRRSMRRVLPSDIYDKSNSPDALAAAEAGACLIGERLAGRGTSHGVARTRPLSCVCRSRRCVVPGALRPSSCSGNRDFRRRDRPSHRPAGERVTIDPGAVSDRVRRSAPAASAADGRDRPGRDRPPLRDRSGATVVHALLGDRVIIHAGCKIGRDGLATCPGRKG
jgi:UDP-3-O-[3-hydroxymyristoyl] glucosamine N-acyltransferase